MIGAIRNRKPTLVRRPEGLLGRELDDFSASGLQEPERPDAVWGRSGPESARAACARRRSGPAGIAKITPKITSDLMIWTHHGLVRSWTSARDAHGLRTSTSGSVSAVGGVGGDSGREEHRPGEDAALRTAAGSRFRRVPFWAILDRLAGVAIPSRLASLGRESSACWRAIAKCRGGGEISTSGRKPQIGR